MSLDKVHLSFINRVRSCVEYTWLPSPGPKYLWTRPNWHLFNTVFFYCPVFKWEVQNWKEFCLKINISKENYWILRIGVAGRCQKKGLNLTFKVNFVCQKSLESFPFFSLKNTNLGVHILLLTFFDKINFKITLLLKWCSIFDS